MTPHNAVRTVAANLPAELWVVLVNGDHDIVVLHGSRRSRRYRQRGRRLAPCDEEFIECLDDGTIV